MGRSHEMMRSLHRQIDARLEENSRKETASTCLVTANLVIWGYCRLPIKWPRLRSPLPNPPLISNSRMIQANDPLPILLSLDISQTMTQ
jgi:hypothetical protein